MLKKFFSLIWQGITRLAEDLNRAEIERAKWRNEFIRKYGYDPLPDRPFDHLSMF